MFFSKICIHQIIKKKRKEKENSALQSQEYLYFKIYLNIINISQYCFYCILINAALVTSFKNMNNLNYSKPLTPGVAFKRFL